MNTELIIILFIVTFVKFAAADNAAPVLNRISKNVFSTLDMDEDGKISKEELFGKLKTTIPQEFFAKVSKLYTAADSNKDGSLTLKEASAIKAGNSFVAEVVASIFPILVNGPAPPVPSGKLNKAQALNVFKKLDRNGGGLLSDDEVSAALVRAGYGTHLVIEMFEAEDGPAKDDKDSHLDIKEASSPVAYRGSKVSLLQVMAPLLQKAG